MTNMRNKAKSLCTASEFELASLSSPKNIVKLSAAQLQQKAARTRNLLDKWRGQAQGQRRAAQQKSGSRETSAAARSAEKAELFTDVLRRFESQLAKTGKPAATPSSARKESPRKTRNRQHRATRAAVRGELAELRLEHGTKKPAHRKPAKRASKIAAPPVQVIESEPAPKPRAKRKMMSTRLAKSMPAVAADASPRQPQIAAGKQRRATTRAKQSRLQAAGIKRTQKHLSAQNKRNQAKRDSR